MSRLAKKPIAVPAGVEISQNAGLVKVKGAKGTLQRKLPPCTAMKLQDGKIQVTTVGKHPNLKAFHGLAWATLRNMVVGVSKGFTRELQLEGIGFRGKVEGKRLVLSVGFTHPIEVDIPEGLKVEVTGKKAEEIMISGADKEMVGQWTAALRMRRPPEPYKGKGIRYKDEHVKLKAGKRVGA